MFIKTALSVCLSAYTQCLKVGFDVSALRAAGFSDYELLSSGLFSDPQLKQVGCDVQRVALLTFFDATGSR